MRDSNKRRLDVAMERDSDTLESLSRDAKLHHMSDQLGKMAAIRLADYYLIAEKLGTYSAEGILVALTMVPGLTTSGTIAQETPDNISPLLREEPYIAPAETLEENVDEAADIWGSM